MEMGAVGREVRMGIIGVGCRGKEQIKVLASMPDVKLAVVCDEYEDRMQAAQAQVQDLCGYMPDGTTNYREVLAREDIEAVVIMTSWQTHLTIAIEAIRAGKIPGLEVGGAASLDECWQLVHASEETGIPCMLLENCCYGKTEMALLRMVREGIFGEVVHCRGGYEHDLRGEIGNGDINRHYRQDNFLCRNAELYPTHELGPIAKYLSLNHGNRMTTLTSMASKAAGMKAWMQDHRPNDPIAAKTFNEGDIVTTMIKCANGETILLTHDCTLPRAYSRGGRVQGTRGVWVEDGKLIFLEGRSPEDPTYWTHRWESDEAYMEEFNHPLWAEYEAYGLRGGHGGMDYLVLRAFVESIQEKKPFPIDVYDTAAWMAITVLSEESIAMGSMPVAVPDFTNGRWMHRTDKATGRYALD